MNEMDRHRQVRGGNLTPAASRVLDCASDLFYREGIRAVGVEAIAEAAGVTKKTLYDRFGSKEELVASYLSLRDRRWREFLTGYVDHHATTPRERILAVFDALGQWMTDENPRGCGFVNAHVELTDQAHPGRRVIEDQKQWFLRYLTDLCIRAGLQQPEETAGRLLLIHEGATVTESMHSTEHSVIKARNIADSIVGVALANTD